MTPDAQSLSVPVVEDNPLNAKLTRLVLQQEGCRVETAPNAPQALEILSRIKPHVIRFSDDSAEIQCLVVRRSCGLKGPDHTVAARLSAASRINTSR